jgi:NitT/TauT family transport system substrate-binding protein
MTFTPPQALPAAADRPAMNRRAALCRLGAAAAAAGALAGCAAPQPPLRVGSIVFPGYEMVFLARDLGLLDERQVRLIEMPSNTDTLRALASGQLEAANLTLDECISARAEGLDLRVLAVLDISAGADAVYSRRPMALAQLAGKRIAVEDSAVGATVLAALLDAAGLRPDQIVKVPTVLPSSGRAFASGRADVVITAEPWASQIEAAGGHRLFDSTAMPGRIVDVMVAQAQAVRLRPEAVGHLVRAHFSGLAHWRQQPEDAARRLAPRLEIAPEQVAGVFRGLELPDRARNLELLRDGGQIDATARLLQQDMLRQGLMRQSQPLSAISDTTALRLNEGQP